MVRRGYHDLTAKYNVYFNGNESFKEALDKIDEGWKDDYTHILPVFKIDNEAAVSGASASLERAISKSIKCISEHSIKVKPKKLKDKRNLTDKEKKFFNKVEYNNFVDDSYMIIGKANMYKKEFRTSIEAFQLIIKNYDDPKIQYPAMIGLARTYILKKEYRDALEILERIQRRDNLKKLIKEDFYSTRAYYYLQQNKYPEGIDDLQKALSLSKKKKNKIRYRFILGQLHQELGDFQKASVQYQKVVKMNPPYEMSFNARIRLANTYTKGADAEKIRALLMKMLKDEKNKDFRDQIYFALGNLSMREKDEATALVNYKQSVAESTTNDIQKTNSYLAIADIYYNKREYRNAGMYYDSSSLFITENFPNYSVIHARTLLLVDLVDYINTYELHDSLLTLANMSEGDRLRKIDNMIAMHREKERQQQIDEMRQMQEANYFQSRLAQNNTATAGGSKWYFYNSQTLQIGKKDFLAKWGNRKLEDNWRRKNKQVLESSEMSENESEQEGDEAKKEAARVTDPTKREFYLQDIPLTDSAQKISHAAIETSLLSAASIFKSDLNEPLEAIKMYELLVAKYPQGQYAVLGYYQLYRLHSSVNNVAEAEKYKQIILSQYTQSNFAKVILDPSYLEKISSEADKFATFFESTYAYYKNQQYSNVIQNVNNAQPEFGKHPQWAKADFLRVLSIGASNDIKLFRAELVKYIEKYPKQANDNYANDMLARLDSDKKEIKQEEDIKVALEIYTLNLTATHYFIAIVPADANFNQLKFNFISFHTDYYENQNFNINEIDLDGKFKMLQIEPFQNLAEINSYYAKLRSNMDIINKDIQTDNLRMMSISDENFLTLQQDKDPEKYYQFFIKKYSWDAY